MARKSGDALKHVALMAAIGEEVVAIVKESGVLQRRRGRKPGRKNSARVKSTTPAKRKKSAKKPKGESAAQRLKDVA